MASQLTMPKLSDSMAEAVIVRWLKAPGDAFARGEALIEVETDKATVVYEAEADGKLDSILVPDGGTAAIGEPIATLVDGERTQQTIARRMVESATTIPVFTVSADIDMSLITQLRRGAREERDDIPSVNDF